jgi:hypothetical protein
MMMRIFAAAAAAAGEGLGARFMVAEAHTLWRRVVCLYTAAAAAAVQHDLFEGEHRDRCRQGCQRHYQLACTPVA